MKFRNQLTFVLFVVLGLFLSACGPKLTLQATPTPTLTPTTLMTHTPLPTQTPALVSLPTSAASDVEMICDDWALIENGEYRAENNTWGKGTISGWSQCIGLGNNTDGTLHGRWTWDWLNAGGNVKAYPEIVFGQKPGSSTTSLSLPEKINRIGSATVSYDFTSNYTGSGNTAFDIWLTDTNNPSTWGVPPITHEIMIWLDRYGGMSPGGAWKERVELDGSTYTVNVGENYGDGWRYIAFVSAKPQLGAGTLNLASFLEYLLEKGLVTGEEYLASIEFGNEIVTGTGETLVDRYEVTVQLKE